MQEDGRSMNGSYHFGFRNGYFSPDYLVWQERADMLPGTSYTSHLGLLLVEALINIMAQHHSGVPKSTCL